jgi:hypothetical protein
VPILRLSFSQPNMRSMMLRCRYFGRSNSLGNPGLGLRCSQWNHRLHSVTVAVLTQLLGIVTLVCQQPAAALAGPTLLAGDAYLIEKYLGIRYVAGLTRCQQKA